MKLKTNGKIAIIIIVAVGGFFLLKPLIGGKKLGEDPPVATIPAGDTLNIKPTATGYLRDSDYVEVKKNVLMQKEENRLKRRIAPKVEKKLVEKKEPPKKKKNGERENLDVKF